MNVAFLCFVLFFLELGMQLFKKMYGGTHLYVVAFKGFYVLPLLATSLIDRPYAVRGTSVI